MSSRDYYKVTYSNCNTNSNGRSSNRTRLMDSHDVLDNETEFNANHFKLYDDFTADLRINFNSIRNFHEVRSEVRRRGDPNDSGVDVENGNPLDDATASNDSDLLENEVMVDPWSSMDSSNSPLTDSVPSASEDCTPSTSSEPHRGSLEVSSPVSPDTRRLPDPNDTKPKNENNNSSKTADKARSRDLTLELETLEPDPLLRRPHFLDDDFPPSRLNIECRIPKPHFLDHSPSPDEFDERSDITNPNFLDDDVDGDDNQAQKKTGALPKRPARTPSTSYGTTEDRPHRSSYRSTLPYGLENAARSSERDKRASQLYRGTWPGEREVWTGHDSASVRSFSSNGSDCPRPSSNLENKMECVCSLISLLSLSPENNADLSGPLLDMSRSVESCIAMRQAGCIPLLVQLIHSKVPRETRDRAAKALRNIIHTQTDDKAGRREARVWRLLEQVREYCYALEDLVESRKEGKEVVEDDATKHPSQSVAALMKLSFDEEHRHVVCQLGGLQALAALVSGDQAAHGSRTDDNTCLTMRKYAGMTLTNLTFGDGNNKSLLCSFKDFMMALVEQLESPNDDMRQVTAAVLRNLSWRADTNSKQVLREVGAVKGLTKAAMTCQKEATLKSVLSALWNLTAHCSMNKVALCSVEGALGFLVDMLSYNSPTKTLAIVENAGGIMRNVSSHIAVREDYRQILRERNCLSVLLQHLKSPSLTVVSNSCGTLWNLSARCPQDQQFLWDHGAVPMLRSLIHSKHKMIAMGSSAALKNLLNSKPGKTHIISLDTTARNMNLPALPTLGARKQKALEQELDQNLAETCDNIEPATSPTTSNRDEKNLYDKISTERQIAMNLERHRMTSSSPLMGNLSSQISLSHSAHLASYLSCSNTLLKGALVTRSSGGSAGNVNRSESKDSVTSTHSDSVFERVMRTGKVPVPTPRNKDLMKMESGSDDFKSSSKPLSRDSTYLRYSNQPPIPPPRSSTDMRTNYTESGYDVDQDSCDQPIDFSRKYSETKTSESEPPLSEKQKTSETNKKYSKKESATNFGDYQETDLDQPTDYSLRYAEHQSETGSDISEPPGPSVHEDTIKHFATEGTPYETPIIFSTATSMSDLRVIGKDAKPKVTPNVKEHPEVMTHSDEKDTCSIEDPPRHDNDRAISTIQVASTSAPVVEKRGVFDTKFSSGMISPEKPVNYCDEGTPGYFSRVSSLSSLGEPTEEDCLAKKNAMATINVDPSPQEQSTSSSGKDKEGSKAVTFATEPADVAEGGEGGEGGTPRFVEDTPLMFSRSSSLGSLPECSQQDDQGSVLSEISRLTSGCISPSEIPDSPGHSAPLSPRSRHAHADPPRDITPPPDCSAAVSVVAEGAEGEGRAEGAGAETSVFAERVAHYVVEHTPAQFSARTSLSSLTINDDPPKQPLLLGKPSSQDSDAPPSRNEESAAQPVENRQENQPREDSLHVRDNLKGTQTPGDTCKVYFTEDTPAILSKAGSHSDLSALSVDSAPARPAPAPAGRPAPRTPRAPLAPCSAPHDTSDSSNLSDAGDLLEECIQKGIAQVVKNKGPPSEVSSINPYPLRDDVYRSLPPYLRSSTETVKMSHEFARNIRDSRSSSASGSPPPLPPKAGRSAAPPRPPPPADTPADMPADMPADTFTDPPDDPAAKGSTHESRSHVKSVSVTREKPRLPVTTNLMRNDSLSSLSLDSFGSTDREIFEETVKAGLSSVNPRAKFTLESYKGKAHSVERPSEASRHSRHHRSLDRSDKIAQHRPKVYDAEFERNLASGAYSLKSSTRMRRSDQDFGSSLTRSPYSYHGEAGGSLAHRPRARPADGPPSLPARIDEPRRHERSDSPSSLSNESFGSTDKEVFERCVRMGMAKPSRRRDDKLRVRSDDRLEARDGRRRGRREAPSGGALERLGGERGLLEEVIARGAGLEAGTAAARARKPSKNVPPPSAARAAAGGQGTLARGPPPGSDPAGLPGPARDRIPAPERGPADADPRRAASPDREEPDRQDSAIDTSTDLETTQESEVLVVFERSNELPTVDSGNTTFESSDAVDIDRSNECLAPKSANTTIESDKDELNRSNESYADVLDGSWSDEGPAPGPYDAATLTRRSKRKMEWTDIKVTKPEENYDAIQLDQFDAHVDDVSRHDTWNDNTCPDDVTFPTISGSVHMVSSIRSEVVDPALALPDLLEKSDTANLLSRPDLTDKLDGLTGSKHEDKVLENVEEPAYTSIIIDESEQKFDSLMAAAIEKEAARLAAQLKNSHYMETSATSLTSLDLDNVKPPSNLGSLLSLSASGHWEESTALTSKKSQKSRKKSLPAALVKRALSNSAQQGSSENLDSMPLSFLDNVKPPSEMENIDMEGSMISVSSIVSEVADVKEKTPIIFDFKQPIQDFPLCSNFTVFHDLDKVNPPSLFDEMAESTLEIDPTTAQQVYDDCVSNTLNVVTDIPSGSENCTPLPSDVSSVESTPKRQRDPKYLTPKEKRNAAKYRYQTYTITDNVSEQDAVLEVESEQFVTWTKSESDRSDEYVTANSESKSKRKLSAKQRRIEDRARYQTQTVDIHNILSQDPNPKHDPHLESLKQRLAAKKTMKQKRVEDAERFRTRTLSEDIPPSPTFVTKDANFENVETTTGYDSLSSNEPNHQQILDDRQSDDVFRDADSGHNEDDFELNSTQMKTYTRSFRNYLPVIESPAAVDMCVVNNLKNIEMTASYRRAMHADKSHPASSGDFASYEGDSNSEGKPHSESDSESPPSRPKPKIIKPEPRDESLDSNDSGDKEPEAPKAVRGRKKAMYVSPYRRSAPPAKKTTTPLKPAPKATPKAPASKTQTGAKTPAKTPALKPTSANTSPKKAPNRSPTKTVQRASTGSGAPATPTTPRPLPLERQGTFTKEDSSVPPEALPVPDKKPVPKPSGVPAPGKPANTSPSRLPQFGRYARPPVNKSPASQPKPSKPAAKKTPEPAMKNSPSNHSLQSNDSGKTIVLARGSRQGSTSSVNSASSSKTRDVESKIANLWKKTDQAKKAVKRVGISDEADPPKLIRSSTFEGQPKQSQIQAPKQKSAIGIRISQIPSLRPKTTAKATTQPSAARKPTTSRLFARKPLSGQVTS